MDPILEVKDLIVQFHTQDGIVHAVNGVSYAAEAGQTLGIVGESGCGKSVSVLSAMRLIPEPPGKIVAGEIMYKGQDLLKLDKASIQDIRGNEIAMVFQDPMTSFNPVLTIGQQVSESTIFHLGFDQKEAREKSVELLELVGIPGAEERIDDYPHQFSGGMRQRAMIAMALACNPSLLIADEPTTALDVTIQAQIVELVKGLSDQFEMSIIWITHDLGVIAEIADRVVVMYAGYVVEEADVFNLFDYPSHPYTLSLLKSLPRVDTISKEKLATIPGAPPDCLSLPPGCPFAPRCTFTSERCQQENPALQQINLDHEIACWVDVNSGRER
ncbi:MAG: ABC transporter ATP-binding protein [Anaerolineales bacterium]|nr:ABC transporter ATP-binding protein [Anaerolineales bacterium]